MDLKWILAIGLEAGFWMMLAAFLVLRYRYGMESITRLFVIGVVLDTAGIVALGVWDFAETGQVSAYTLVRRGADRLQPHLGRQHLEHLDRVDGAQDPAAARRRARATSRPCPDRP